MTNENAHTIGGDPTQPVFLSPSLLGSSGKAAQWTVTLDNTNGQAPMKTLLGDYNNLLAVKMGATVVDVANVDGTFGQDTLGIMKHYSATVPVALMGIHVMASDAAFFAQGRITAAIADIENQAPRTKLINFATAVSGATFDKTVRQDPAFKFLLNGITGIFLEVPKGMKVTFTFDIIGHATAHGILPV